MIVWLLTLLVVGLGLSAFFSGAETGFYRATRTRLALDALGGDAVSRGLIWLTNNPALFVATILVGNNLANYMMTSAIVMLTVTWGGGMGHVAELMTSILVSPVIFVYGELLPKNLFYQAPNRLLRRSGPLVLLFTVALAPISAVLWMLSRLVQSLVGEAPERLQLQLVRHELQRVLTEGHDAGVLSPAQRQLADGLFRIANEPLVKFCLPVARFATVRIGADRSEVLRLAHRHRTSLLLVTEGRSRRCVGYVSLVELSLQGATTVTAAKPLLKITHRDSPIAALMKMRIEKELIGEVLDDAGRTLGIVAVEALTEPLFDSGKVTAALVV